MCAVGPEHRRAAAAACVRALVKDAGRLQVHCQAQLRQRVMAAALGCTASDAFTPGRAGERATARCGQAAAVQQQLHPCRRARPAQQISTQLHSALQRERWRPVAALAQHSEHTPCFGGWRHAQGGVQGGLQRSLHCRVETRRIVSAAVGAAAGASTSAPFARCPVQPASSLKSSETQAASSWSQHRRQPASHQRARSDLAPPHPPQHLPGGSLHQPRRPVTVLLDPPVGSVNRPVPPVPRGGAERRAAHGGALHQAPRF